MLCVYSTLLLLSFSGHCSHSTSALGLGKINNKNALACSLHETALVPGITIGGLDVFLSSYHPLQLH